jgi:hypothetical protein
MATVKELGFLAKLKLLFKIQKPAGELIKTVGQAKDETRGWRTIGFWITLVGTLSSTALALTGVIPAPAQLVATTILQAAYNILRGAQSANSSTAKGTFRTTEFWLSTLTEIQKGLVAVESGGIRPEWISSATAIVGASLAAGQNLAMRRPDAEVLPSK